MENEWHKITNEIRATREGKFKEEKKNGKKNEK